jgi:hypothetical protein
MQDASVATLLGLFVHARLLLREAAAAAAQPSGTMLRRRLLPQEPARPPLFGGAVVSLRAA